MLQPYRQQIGIPREAGGGVSDIVDTRVASNAGQLDDLGRQLQSIAAPRLEQEAINKAQENAGSMILERDKQGRLVAPERTLEGGIVYQQAFDRVVQARYLSEVGGDFQKFLDDEMAARRQGDKPFDANDYAQTIESYKQGMLEGVPGWLRAETEELFTREAQERTRAFTNEVSREKQINFINGTNDLIKFHMSSLSPEALALEAKSSGRTVEEVQASHELAIMNLTEAMLDRGFSGDKEAQALFMTLERNSDGLENYYSGARLLAQNITSIMSLDEEGLDQIELGLNGVDTITEKGLTGTVRTSTGVNERVTPELITGAYRTLTGKDPTQVARDPNSALGRANPRSYHIQGRAVDSPRIPGMTFEEYVSWWKKQGFEVVEAIDEYKNPSKHATGGHWHVAFGNAREVIKEEAAGTKVGLTFEDINALDTTHKQALRQIISNRRQALREEEMFRRQQAAEAARAAREEANTRAIVDSIEAMQDAGIQGHYNSKEKGVLEQQADAAIDWSQIGTEQQRANLLRFAQVNNYLPRKASGYLDNMIRSSDWEGSLQLYRGLKDATLPSGAKVGDLLLARLDSRTAALLQHADSLASGPRQSFEQISARLESLRSGKGFTVEEGKAEFNRRFAEGGKTYDQFRDTAIRNAFRIGNAPALEPGLKRDVDNAFASNLDIYGDAEVALQQAIKQVKGNHTASGVFANGIGPASLLNSYDLHEKLAPFFFKETNAATGQPLIRRVPGQTHRLGGSNSSVKLVPIDSERDGIGRYRVLVYEPDNPRNLIDMFELDLGKELREHYGVGDRKSSIVQRADLISQAREKRTATQQSLTRIGQSADRGPKY